MYKCRKDFFTHLQDQHRVKQGVKVLLMSKFKPIP